MAQEIKVLIIDDQTVFRDSLARALGTEPGIQVVGRCATIPAALEVIRREPVDVVLLDYDLGLERGTQFLPDARACGFSGVVVVLTAGLNTQAAADLVRQGISAMMLKTESLERLVEVIQTAAKGVVALDERQFRHAFGQPAGFMLKFTERDQRVVSHLMQGLSNKEIAARINVSEASVKATLQRIFAMAGVRTRSQLICLMLEEHGWAKNAAPDENPTT